MDDVSFEFSAGETLGLEGESGCGKRVTAMSLMRLVSPGRITHGEVTFDGQDLMGMTEQQIRGIRGNKLAMIFQDPLTSLNPALTVGRQISEILEVHLHMNRPAARDRALELLELVEIPERGCPGLC